MSLPYPDNTVWYVEAASADGQDRACGSAVAVSVQALEAPTTPRTYLLTCGHVVRGRVPGATAQESQAGFGPLLPNIGVWGPDTGFALRQRVWALVANEIKNVRPGIVPEPERSNAAADWVLLRLDDAQASLAADAVREFAEDPSGELTILGYPGGADSFVRGKVIPTRGDDLSFRDSYHGVVRLNGTETRSGMSGGGVFDEAGALVGIHRSRVDAVLQCHSVSIASIREQLHAAGYQLVTGRRPARRVSRRVLLQAGAAGLVGIAGAGIWWTQRATRVSMGIKPFVGYAPLKVIAALGLAPGLDLQFTELETVSQMKEGVKRRELDTGLWLSCTHGLFCSEETPVRAKAVLKLDDSKAGDGIVVSDSIGDVSELEGKIIAYQKHDAGEYLFREFCEQHGVDFLALVHPWDHTSASDAADRFLDREAQAISTYEPYLGKLKRELEVSPRWTAQDLGEFGIVDVLAVQEDFLAAYPDAVRKLIDGWYEAVDLIYRGDAAAVDAAVEYIRTGEPGFTSDDLTAVIQPDVVPLADEAENCRYFRRTRGVSKFRRDYEHGLETFRSAVFRPLGFEQADGSQDFLRC